MVRMGLNVEVFPPTKTRAEMVSRLEEKEFDVFVSCGCPWILPISKIKKENQIFINIHPSLLPDLKGKSPILEAIEQNKPMGATIHHMVDEVDSGPIIAQIPINPDRNNLNECYRSVFVAEVKVFKMAHERNFEPK